MTTRLLRLLPVVAALALALAIAGPAESSLVAGAVAAAAAIAVTIAVLAVRAPTRTAAAGLHARPALPDGQPEPAHPHTSGRPRPRAPGRALPAASS